MGKRARGLTVIPSAYSGRREALTPQYRASQSPVRACPESPETGSQASEHVASLQPRDLFRGPTDLRLPAYCVQCPAVWLRSAHSVWPNSHLVDLVREATVLA